MVKPISGSREMYPTPPRTGSHPGQWSQPPPPLPHSQHPHYPGRSFHGYGHPPPLPPPLPASSHHHRYPPPPPHHHHHGHGPPRSPHPYYISSRGRPHSHQPHQPHHPPSRPPPPLEVPTSGSTAAVRPLYKTQSIHPALVTPQTPHGPPPLTHRPPPSHYASSPQRVSSSNVPTTPSSIPPVMHTPNSNQGDLAASNSNMVTTKPPRPYTEYTMFYQLEREYILHRLLVDKDDPKAKEEQEEQSQVALFKDDPLMPQRYRTLPGKIGFLELTRMIAARWGEVDDETRKYCKMMAAMELVKYKEDVESYNAYKARLEKIGEVPEDVKEKERKKRAKDKRREKLNDAAAGGKKFNDDNFKSDRKPSSKPSSQEARHDVDNDMEQFITSLVNNDAHGRKRPSSPPPIQGIYREDSILHPPHYDAPWNAFMPAPREKRRMLPPPPVARHNPTVASSKLITPERSAKRRRLPVHRNANADRTAQSSLAQSHPSTEAAAILNAGPVSPDEDELIHMTFSGIDENEIAREFYFPTHPGVAGSSPGNASAAPHAAPAASLQATSLPGMQDAEHHPTNQTTEALYGPPIQSFDYWDALMDPPTNHH